jgi:hypothetical protein
MRHVVEGPRGLCYDDHGEGRLKVLRCVGDIPTPRSSLSLVAVSPGRDAAACGVLDGSVWCWGQGYSPPDDLAQLVEIVPESLPVPEVAAVEETDAAAGPPWEPYCLVQRGCGHRPTAIPPCAAGTEARDWSDLLASAENQSSQEVHVRGLLGVGRRTFGWNNACVREGFRACCNREGADVVLGGATETLGLPDLSCSGDESLLCCDVPAYGQVVVATGRLTRATHERSPPDPRWTLESARLCVEPASPGDH